MSDNLPPKYRKDFFSKLIRKLKMFFIKSGEKNKFLIPENIEEKNKKRNKDNILEYLKVDISLNINNEYEKREFMDNLTRNPELLEIFSNARLEEILQYYLNENEKKRALLKENY